MSKVASASTGKWTPGKDPALFIDSTAGTWKAMVHDDGTWNVRGPDPDNAAHYADGEATNADVGEGSSLDAKARVAAAKRIARAYIMEQLASTGTKKTKAQLDAEIKAELTKLLSSPTAAKKPRAPRKAKGKPARETKRQELERIVEERAASARYSHRHGLPDSSERQGELKGARTELARCIAMDLGHAPTHQGVSFECFQCSASGTMDPTPEGKIFTDVCTHPKAAAQIAYRSTL